MAGVYHANEGAAEYALTSIRFPKELLPEIDRYAAEHHLSRNSAIVFMCSAFADSGMTGRRVKRMTRGHASG
jgi:hypothetical protein